MPAFNTRKVQSKRETALTSASAATAILAGIDAASIEWGGRTRQKKYLTGNLNPADLFQQTSDGAKIKISGDLSIEDGPILIDQGADDAFLAEQLRPELFQAACDAANQPLLLRQHAGYDHSYWFIQSFIEDHLRHHARVLSP